MSSATPAQCNDLVTDMTDLTAASGNHSKEDTKSKGTPTAVVNSSVASAAAAPAPTPAKPLPCWVSAARAAKPLLTYMESLNIAAAQDGLFVCTICERLDDLPHKVGDYNWCSKCFVKLSGCQKCYKGTWCRGDAKTYFDDYATTVKVDGELYFGSHGCVLCGWRRLELECVKCGKTRRDKGEVSNGVFTCYSCAHPPASVSYYPSYATDCVVCGIGNKCLHGDKFT